MSMIYRKIPSDNSSSFYTEESLDNNFHYLEDRIQFLENRVQYLEHRLPGRSIIQVQRTPRVEDEGGGIITPERWTFNTLDGEVTAVWSTTPRADTGILGFPANRPGIIFTFNGFKRFPAQIYMLDNRTGEIHNVLNLSSSPDHPMGYFGKSLSPNIVTSFDPGKHKMYYQLDPEMDSNEWHFEIRE